MKSGVCLVALLPACGGGASFAGAQEAEPSPKQQPSAVLPEIKVIVPAAPPKPAKSKSNAKTKAPAPAVVSAPAEPIQASVADAKKAEVGNGAPGTGTTGIDGYVATGTSTATKTNTAIKDIPQSISVVTRQQAEDRGSESVGEALAYVPGVAVAQGEGHRDQITIRGQVTTADFFVDGIRDDIEYYRDLYNVETIEVLKGPAAMVFGRGGGGGVVNRVTKKADGERVREVTVNTGMYDRKRTTLDVGDAIGSAGAFRLNAMYEDSESFRDYFELERYGINPEMAFKLNDRTKLSVSYEYYKDDRTVDRGVPSLRGQPSNGPIETFFGNPDASRAEFEGQTATVTLEHRTDFGLNLRSHTSYSDADKAYQNVFATGPVNPVTNTVALGGYRDQTSRESFVSQTDATYRVDMGDAIRHTFATGVEFSRQETENRRDLPRFNSPTSATFSLTVPFSSPTVFNPVFFNRLNRQRQTELEVASGYVQDQLEITRHLEIIGGLRFDRFDLAFHNDMNGQSISRVDEVWSPRIGVVFKPFEALSLYVSRSESFLPGAGDQFNNSPVNTVTGDTLEPEKFENKELGFKWEIAPRLFFTGALFSLDRTNEIVAAGPFNGEQVGLTRTEGGELALTGYVTEKWQVSAGWGHQVSEVVVGAPASVGKEKPFVPHDVYSLWNRYQMTSVFGFGVGVIHQSESFAEINNLVELPAFTRVDAALFVNFNENWQAQLNVENVLDETYYASAHNNNNISPGAPRSAYVTVRAKF